jgi:hypothetical protein
VRFRWSEVMCGQGRGRTADLPLFSEPSIHAVAWTNALATVSLGTHEAQRSLAPCERHVLTVPPSTLVSLTETYSSTSSNMSLSVTKDAVAPEAPPTDPPGIGGGEMPSSSVRSCSRRIQ